MKRTIAILLISFFGMTAGNAATVKLKTVVIDPGHGGHDPGCVSKDKKTYEKTLTLDISRKLAAKISHACPDVEVVMTRTKDVYVTLNDRAEIANRSGANLFISIHVNSIPSTAPSGCSVHILGQSSEKDRDLFAFNMDVCRRENSVIMMEEDYTTKYHGFDPTDYESYIFMQLMQDAYLEQSLEFAQICSKRLKQSPIRTSKGLWQDPFYVLWKTSMPAVLVELGFMSNSSDLEILRNESSRDKFADQLLAAFLEFKRKYDDSVNLDAGRPVEKTTEKEAAISETISAGKPEETDRNGVSVSGERYGIQIFSLKTRIPENDRRLLGYKAVIVEKYPLFKYVISVSTDIETVRKNLPEIRKTYPDSFIVTLP